MSEPEAQPGKAIGLLGTFDVENYGDMLFPLIAQWRLAPHGIAVEAYSPGGGTTRWADCAPCHPLSALLPRSDGLAALLVGGGNIVHRQPANLPDYPGAADRWAYSGLWGGAAVVAAIANKPLLWNAPGVAKAFAPDELAGIVHPALQACDYLSVRDAQSRDWLAPPKGVEVTVVPDTVADIARMWPKSELRAANRELRARKGMGARQRYAVLHVKRRSVRPGDEPLIAAGIDAMARATGLMPLLLAIGPCHGDDAMARNLGGALTVPHAIVDDARGLIEMAAAIAYAGRYVGCSLHGYITASAYGVPGTIVALPPLPKQAGFLAHVGRPGDLAADWRAALEAMSGEAARATRTPPSVFRALDAHWARIADAIDRPQAGSYATRTRFLRKFVRNGLDGAGWDWTLPGFLLQTR
jgi:polysaccharide pyruvyl transferase WcaK-like protein